MTGLFVFLFLFSFSHQSEGTRKRRREGDPSPRGKLHPQREHPAPVRRSHVCATTLAVIFTQTITECEA